MLRFFIGLLCVSLFFVSCLKGSRDRACAFPSTSIVAPQWEQDSVEAYLDSNHITAVKHSSGFYYKILNPGSSTDTIGLCTQILVSYEGKVANVDTAFDKKPDGVFVIGSLIEGWKKGIPLIRKGGEINLYIPPSLGYGNKDFKDENGKLIIPKNSILTFNIKLLDYREY